MWINKNGEKYHIGDAKRETRRDVREQIVESGFCGEDTLIRPSSGLLSLLLITFILCVCVCVSVTDGNGGTHSRSTSDITTPPSNPTALLKPNNDILNGELMHT